MTLYTYRRDMSDTTKGLKELAKLNDEEREIVYNKFRENGASEKAINELKSFVMVASWFKK